MSLQLFSSILLLSFSLLSCQSAKLSERKPASEHETNSLSGTRVNPVTVQQSVYTSINLHDGDFNQWQTGELRLKKYDISNPQDLLRLTQRLNELESMSELFPKAANNSIKEAISLAKMIQNNKFSAKDQLDSAIHLAEVVAAFNYNFQYPIKDQVWILALPFKLLSDLDNPMMANKAKTATNLNSQDSHKPLDQRDPVDSTFWKKPSAISEKNLYYGFNRNKIPHFPSVCTYDGPKESFGIHGGFSLKCDGKKWKFKFGNETKTEPFNSRIVWALGYNAVPVDYVKPGVRVAFDSKIYNEYNMRKELSIKVKSILGFQYFKKNLQEVRNPFKEAILGAELKDGTFISSEELEKNISTYEDKISNVVLREASVESELENEKSLGPWGWNDFDHRSRRELRGFGIVAGFLNLFDLRTDNNKLRLKKNPDGSTELAHYINDLGSGLGNAKNFFQNSNGAFDQFPWDFIKKRPSIKPPMAGQKGGAPQWQSPYVFLHFNLIQENKALRDMQPNDARWAAKMLAQISETQLTDALIAAGLTASETTLVLEKLISRRQGLLKTLGLEKEFPDLMSRIVDKKLNYDPRSQEIPAAMGSQEMTRAPMGDTLIRLGKLKKF